MLPVIPVATNKLLQDAQGRPSTYPFPPNIAAAFPAPIRKKIFQWILSNYCWPQIMQRQPYESQWDKLLNMARASWKLSDLKLDEKSRLAKNQQQKILAGQGNPGGKADVSDTVIFDAIDRLNNLNHFISFKESLPVQFNIPANTQLPNENDVYSPSADLVTAANCLLKFNADGSNFYRGHWINGKHHYTYGVSFVNSEFKQRVGPVKRRQADGSFAEQNEILELCTTFEPISIRKLWLNTNITAYNMQYQPCPFFYEQIPRFAVTANRYDPTLNPFGYVNLQSLPPGQWLFTGQEMSSLENAYKQLYPESTLQTLSKPELSVELKWVLYPMLPLKFIPLQELEALKMGESSGIALPPSDKALLQSLQSDYSEEKDQQLVATQGGVWDFDFDGTKGYETKRFIMEAFGTSLVMGNCEIIRLQENFYPQGKIPLYGSCHMPDLDSGLYGPAIGLILESHYVQICKALNQWLDNKDTLNDPPVKMQQNSPAATQDVNLRGQKNLVNGMNDYEAHAILDHTQTTPGFLSAVRETAQTSSKAVDAILGKAMGARTSATEASNVFQTAMSGVTTDINLYNHDISGGYAERVWDYFGLWVDPDILKAITGQYGFAIKPEHLQIRLGLSWDTGSTYIESVTKQGNLRYLLESTVGDPAVNRAELLRELMTEWRMKNLDKIINDGGRDEQILLASNQAAETYLGELIMVDPDQDHMTAIKVKISYLKDRDSFWNTNPETAPRGQLLVQQIQLHQLYLQLQQAQLAAQQQAQGASDGPAGPNETEETKRQAQLPAPESPKNNKPGSAKQTNQ